jgi:nucleoside phosphorylase
MPLSYSDYTVACICPMGVELAGVKAMLDQTHPSLPTQRDQNNYTLGEIEGHNIVIAVLPKIGTNSAAAVAIQLLNDFSSIRFGLLVGIGGGVPDEEEDSNDIRLGDVVISKPTASFGGVVQYDLGKYSTNSGFERTGVLARPPLILQTSVEMLAADHRIRGSRVPQYLSDMLQKNPTMKEEFSHPGAQHDHLFQADYPHPGGPNCRRCDLQRVVKRDARRSEHPKFHYGTIGSANTVVKDARLRDNLRRGLKIICVEMEAAGLMDSFPCLVIRGICDYADSHKNKKWQPYAAATAAAYMKELLSIIPPKDVARVSPAAGVVQIPSESAKDLLTYSHSPNLIFLIRMLDLAASATIKAVIGHSQMLINSSEYDRGLNLFDAPNIDDHLFIGRDEELEQMKTNLLSGPDSPDRKVLVLGGMGGIGKTQMAIHYAKRRRTSYSSIFWLNAASESTLKGSFRILARRILPTDSANVADDDQLWIQVSNWFSELDNTRWLLIFDNYDDPDQYDIERYYPYVSHGSIIITTRLPDRVNGRQIKVRSMNKVHDGLRILATRSDRVGVESGY